MLSNPIRFVAAGFLFFASAALLPGAGRADPGTSSAAQAPAKKGPVSTLELLEWEARIAENGYNTRKSDKRLTDLVGVYERIIAHTCMPQLMKTLQHGGSPTDPQCLEYIEEALKVDPENPMALCARDGIDSKSCSSAYDAQELGTYTKDMDFWPGEETADTQLNLELESSQNHSAQYAKLESELYRLEGLANIDAAHRAKYDSDITEAYEKLIAAACSRPKLRMVALFGDAAGPFREDLLEMVKDSDLRHELASKPREHRSPYLEELKASLDAYRSPSGPKSDEMRPMDQIAKALSLSEGGPGVRRARVRTDGIARWHLISTACETYIKRARERSRQPAAAICAEHGQYSPACINALRRSRSAASRVTAKGTPAAGTIPAPASRNQNFSTF